MLVLDQDYSVFFHSESGLCYLPIPKNASTTFETFFKQQKWEEILLEDFDRSQVKTYFCYIRNPQVRLIKGIAQLLYNKAYLVDDENAMYFILLACYEHHITPVSELIRDIPTEDILFIPLDHPLYSANDITNGLLRNNGINAKVSKKARENKLMSLERVKIIEKLRDGYGLDEYKDGNHLFRVVMDRYADDIELHQTALGCNWGDEFIRLF